MKRILFQPYFRFFRKHPFGSGRRSVSHPSEKTLYRFHERWICGDCGGKNERFHDEIAGSLESLRRSFPYSCVACGAQSSISSSVDLPSASLPALEYWLVHREAYYLSQDQDLILAEYDVATLTEAYARASNLTDGAIKAKVLIGALLVRYSDRLYGQDEEATLKDWLIRHRALWENATFIAQYLRDDVTRALEG